MLKISVTVHYTDGRTADVVVGPATQVAFEREHGVGLGVLAEDTRLTYVYWLAWHASRTGVEFDTWLESLDSIDFEVDGADPTQPAPPAT